MFNYEAMLCLMIGYLCLNIVILSQYRILFPNKSYLYKYHQEKTRCKIDQQDPRLLDRNFRVRIRWRKIVANQLEIDLLSFLTLSTARRVFSGFSPFPLLAVLVELCYLELELSASSTAVISYLLLTAR